VVDHYNSRAEEFDSNGAFVGQVGGAGVPLGSMNFPRGIVVLPSNAPRGWANDIMVCDSENHRMQVFKPASFTTGLGTPPVGRLIPTGTSFLRPQQISVSPDGQSLWVADTNHHRILDVSLSTGAVLENWTASGNPRPAGIIVDSNNHVYVTGTNITEYTSTGGLVRTLATSGSKPGFVRLPDGMAIDSTGTVLYVADTNNNRVDEFDLTATTGGFIQSFGTLGTGDGQFQQPYMVAVSATGQIAVSDFGNNRVSIWHA
jgi:DNA-binding beta-propeller fold protein YncE